MNQIRSIRKLAPSLSDTELVLAARRDESWAREALFHRHVDSLHRLCFTLLGPHSNAREVLEQSFVDAFARLGTLRDPGAFAAWLGRMTVQATLARLSAKRWLGRTLRRRPDFSGFRSQLVLFGNEEERSAVLRYYEVLEELRATWRVALVLRDVEQMDASSVAQTLRVTSLKARRMLLLAERRLRAVGVSAPSVLRSGALPLPVSLSEFERVHLHRRVEAALASRQPRKPWQKHALVALAAAALVTAGVWYLRRHRVDEPGAEVANLAPQIIELPSGSRAILSPSAALRVDMATSAEVRLTLLSGRADFEVGRPDQHKLLVSAGEASIGATGKRFSMSLEPADPASGSHQLELSVADGPVELVRRPNAAPLRLDSGEAWSGRVGALGAPEPRQ